MEPKMSFKIGTPLGAMSAVVAIVYGLSASWSAFSAQPYTSQDLGLYCSSIGIILGVTGAIVGVVSRQITMARSKNAA